MDEWASSLMPDDAQNNVLITEDGQACLGEFGISGAFLLPDLNAYELENCRYMAPEFVSWRLYPNPNRTSKESDVYSLVMTSFSVGFSVVNRPTT